MAHAEATLTALLQKIPAREMAAEADKHAAESFWPEVFACKTMSGVTCAAFVNIGAAMVVATTRANHRPPFRHSLRIRRELRKDRRELHGLHALIDL